MMWAKLLFCRHPEWASWEWPHHTEHGWRRFYFCTRCGVVIHDLVQNHEKDGGR